MGKCLCFALLPRCGTRFFRTRCTFRRQLLLEFFQLFLPLGLQVFGQLRCSQLVCLPQVLQVSRQFLFSFGTQGSKLGLLHFICSPLDFRPGFLLGMGDGLLKGRRLVGPHGGDSGLEARFVLLQLVCAGQQIRFQALDFLFALHLLLLQLGHFRRQALRVL
eukprot:scaffold2262_cov262-Pinguiococcus_pyrenoidosus.AAC.16